ncbi:MAG: Ku protein [Xanthobacteraceae bacterium]
MWPCFEPSIPDEYEYAKNSYLPVDDEELDAVAIDSNHTVEIDSFVPREQIPPDPLTKRCAAEAT